MSTLAARPRPRAAACSSRISARRPGPPAPSPRSTPPSSTTAPRSSSCPPGTASAGARSTSCTLAIPARPRGLPPPHARGGRPEQPGRGSWRATAGGAVPDERRHRDRCSRTGRPRPLRCSARAPDAFHVAPCRAPGPRHALPPPAPSLGAASRARTCTRPSPARAASARSTASSWPRRPAHRHPHPHRPRGAPLLQPRAVQGRPRRRARGVFGARSGCAGRAEDRRPPDQQEPAALRHALVHSTPRSRSSRTT